MDVDQKGDDDEDEGNNKKFITDCQTNEATKVFHRSIVIAYSAFVQ